MNKHTAIALIGIALWLAESAYFGWNEKPSGTPEKYLDLLSGVLIVWGIVGDVLRGVTFVKRNTTVNNINTKTVKVIEPKMKVTTRTKVTQG